MRLRGTDIFVDSFGKSSHGAVYFLTHMHSDHTGGLHNSWERGPIYCSEVSKALLLRRWAIDEDLVHVLEPDSPTMVCVCANGSFGTCEVTMVEANHCPGSSMFIFRASGGDTLNFGTIVATGDFRYEAEYVQERFPRALDQVAGCIDCLYLDDTYCDPRRVFPPRAVVREKLLWALSQLPRCQILIGIDYLGKEELVARLAEGLQMGALVSQARIENIAVALGPDGARFFDSQCRNTQGRIRVVSPRKRLTAEYVASCSLREGPTVGVIPSGFVESAFGDAELSAWVAEAKQKLANDLCPPLLKVPYSLHNSFTELCSFVKRLRPDTVVGICSDTLERKTNLAATVAPFLSGNAPRSAPSSAQVTIGKCGRAPAVSTESAFFEHAAAPGAPALSEPLPASRVLPAEHRRRVQKWRTRLKKLVNPRAKSAAVRRAELNVASATAVGAKAASRSSRGDAPRDDVRSRIKSDARQQPEGDQSATVRQDSAEVGAQVNAMCSVGSDEVKERSTVQQRLQLQRKCLGVRLEDVHDNARKCKEVKSISSDFAPQLHPPSRLKRRRVFAGGANYVNDGKGRRQRWRPSHDRMLLQIVELGKTRSWESSAAIAQLRELLDKSDEECAQRLNELNRRPG